MRREKGISLLELLLGLTIAAVIITIAVRYFFIAEENMRVQETIQLIKNISEAGFSWRAQKKQPDFDVPNAISIENLLDLGLIHPEEKLNPWGGDITVEPANNPKYLKISMNKVPIIACNKIKRALDPTPDSKLAGICEAKTQTYTGEF